LCFDLDELTDFLEADLFRAERIDFDFLYELVFLGRLSEKSDSERPLLDFLDLLESDLLVSDILEVILLLCRDPPERRLYEAFEDRSVSLRSSADLL